MACDPLDLVCKGNELVGDAVGSAVDSGAKNLGEAMMGAWDSITKGFLTSWLDAGLLVDLDGSSVTWLTDQLQVISVFLAVVGIMVACIWTMVHYRGDKAVKVAQSLFSVFLVTTLGTVLVQVGITAADAFSTYVLDEAGVTVGGIGALGAGGAATTVAAIGPGLAIIAGIFGVIATLFQWIIMGLRAVVLPLLIAVWPVSAAGAMVNGGEEMFAKVSKWILAFILYKPVAAIIYAFAWKLKSGGDGIGGVINGMLLLCLAVAALPAIMKLIGPSTNALGKAAGGTMALAAGAAAVSVGVAAGAAVATGGASAGASAGAAGKSTAASTAGPQAATAAGGQASSGGGQAAAALQDKGAAAGGGGAASGGPAPSGSGSATSSGSAPSGSGSAPSGGGAHAAGSTVSAGSSAPGGSAPSAGASGSRGGGDGMKSAGEALGRAVADGARDSDGKDVIGE